MVKKTAIELAKEKLEALQSGTNAGDGNPHVFKPREGDNDIRVTPTSDGDSFQERYLHYGVGGQGFLCPKRNFQEDCAVCDFASAMYREGTEESREISSSIYAKVRYYSPVLDRKDVDKGIRWWSYGKRVYEKLLKLMLNPKFGDFTDPEKGYDLTVSYTLSSGPGTFPSTDLMPDPSTMGTPVAKTKSDRVELLEKVPNLNSTLIRLTSSEVRQRLDDFLAASDNSSGVEKYGASESKKGTSDIDTAFESLTSD